MADALMASSIHAFNLQVDHWNLTRYLNMVLESDWHDDLDVARAVHSPKENLHITVRPLIKD